MRYDFRDVRFADTSGNPLSYYIESYTAFSSAIFWVKLPANSAKILMYYGNGSVNSASSGADTFEFFEDWKTDTIAFGTKWTLLHGTYTWKVGYVTLSSTSLNSIIATNQTFSRGNICEFYITHDKGNRTVTGFYDNPTGKCAAWCGAVTGSDCDQKYCYDTAATWSNDAVTRYGTPPNLYTIKYSNWAYFAVNGVSRGSISTNVPSVALPITFYSEVNKGAIVIYWVRVRKYVSTEPILTLGTKFVRTNNGFVPKHDYFEDSVTIEISTDDAIKDYFTDSVGINISTDFFRGEATKIIDDLTIDVSLVEGPLIRRDELRDYSLVSCDISKSITDAYFQLSAEFADSKVQDENSTVKYYARDAQGTPHLLFWGKNIVNSPVIGSYYSSLHMQAADNTRNLAVQKIPWNYQVISLAGAFSTWPLWVSALVDYHKTGVLVKRIIDTGMPDKQFVFKPETTRLDAINEICRYCGLIFNIKLIEHDGVMVPGFFAVPASEIDQITGGFDLPTSIEFSGQNNYNITASPKIEGIQDEKYNMVTVYGGITSTGETTVASVYTPAVEEGERAREYRIQDNFIEEKGSTAEIEAIKWLLYFNAPRATVSIQFVNRFDFELYQRVRFGTGFTHKLRELTNSIQLPYVIAFDPRDEINSKHTIDVSKVPRPTWLRISEIKYHSTKQTETVDLKLITDYIYSSVDPVVPSPYSQYISPGYFKPVSDDSISTIQDVVTNTVEKQLTPEICTVLSKDEENLTMVVQTQSGKLVTVRYG